MPIYMNWGGENPPKIRGSVTDGAFTGWIEVKSLSKLTNKPMGQGREFAYEAEHDVTITVSDLLVQRAFFAMAARSDGDMDPVEVLMRISNPSAGAKKPPLFLLLGDVRVTAVDVRGDSIKVGLNFNTSTWGHDDRLQPDSPPADLTELQLMLSSLIPIN